MGIQRPVELVEDGYSGHHSVKLYRRCFENEVVQVVLYPNSTYVIQAVDVAGFAPVKA